MEPPRTADYAPGMRRILERMAVASRLRLARSILLKPTRRGTCPICERKTIFVKADEWLRDHYYCARCLSIPRYRAIIRVLRERFPDWRELAIHEASPSGAASAKIARECKRYVSSHFFADTPLGEKKGAHRNEDLEGQTFPDAAFDLVVTQDVFEHVLDPARAFAEVARTLRPGGAHVFTVPWYFWKPTLVRAHGEGGHVIHDQAAEYHHGNPIDAGGSLVVTEWGFGLLEFIERAAGLSTTVEHIFDADQGIDGEFREVFVSRKP
jgi:Methyltransferase domain